MQPPPPGGPRGWGSPPAPPGSGNPGGYGGPGAPGGYGGPPAGPVGGYGIGLPPGVSPDAGAGGGPMYGSQQEPMAIVGLVLAAVAVPMYFCCGAFSLVANVVGLVLGFVSLSRVNSAPERYQGRGLAIGAIIANGLMLLANVVMMIFFFGLMGIGLMSSP